VWKNPNTIKATFAIDANEKVDLACGKKYADCGLEEETVRGINCFP
jgi:hypothetical protein